MNNQNMIETVTRISGVNPRKCMRCGKCSAAFTLDGKILSFETAPDTRYLIFRREFPPENYYHNPFPYHINEGKKTFDRASLGLSAYY